MASDDAKRPLLSEVVPPRHYKKNDLKRRKPRHCKSAPGGFVPSKKNAAGLISPSAPLVGDVKPSFRRVVLFLAIYLGVGCICFCIVKDEIKGVRTNRVLDALYFCIVTMTTVGYGDLVPDSVTTKLLASVFTFCGMALIGLILSKSADYLIEKQENMLVNALHMYKENCEFEILKEKAKHKFLVSLFLLIILVIIGTVFLYTMEELSLVDSFYCVCSTITTLGYGDKSFSTEAGRVFAVFWILTSTICLAQCFLYLAEFRTERRQSDLVKWVLTRKTTITDLEAADLDDDGTVSAAEFVIYKLKEMGKIDEEDISIVMVEFENLDVDQSGTLSSSDLALSSQMGNQVAPF